MVDLTSDTHVFKSLNQNFDSVNQYYQTRAEESANDLSIIRSEMRRSLPIFETMVNFKSLLLSFSAVYVVIIILVIALTCIYLSYICNQLESIQRSLERYERNDKFWDGKLQDKPARDQRDMFQEIESRIVIKKDNVRVDWTPTQGLSPNV